MFWLIQGTQSSTSRSLKRHFKPAGDPSSIAGREPCAALGFVPPATAMPELLSPSPARVPVPGWHHCPRAQAGRAPTEQDLGEMSLIPFQPAGFSPHYQHSGSKVSHRATTPGAPQARSSFPCPIPTHPVGWLLGKGTKGAAAKPHRGQERPERSLPGDRSIGKACPSICLSIHPSIWLGRNPGSVPPPPPPLPAAWLPSRAGADTLIPVTYLSLQLSLNCFGSPSEGRLGREEGGDGKLKVINGWSWWGGAFPCHPCPRHHFAWGSSGQAAPLQVPWGVFPQIVAFWPKNPAQSMATSAGLSGVRGRA